MLALPCWSASRAEIRRRSPGVKNALPEKFHGLWLPAFHDRKFPRADEVRANRSLRAVFVFGIAGFYGRMVAGRPQAGLAPLFPCHRRPALRCDAHSFSHPESTSWPIAFSPSAKSLMGSTLFFRMSGACCTMASAPFRMRLLRCMKRARRARRWCSSPIRRARPPASSPSCVFSACLTRPMTVSSPQVMSPAA